MKLIRVPFLALVTEYAPISPPTAFSLPALKVSTSANVKVVGSFVPSAAVSVFKLMVPSVALPTIPPAFPDSALT